MKVISLHTNYGNKKIIRQLQQNNREVQHKVYTYYAPKMLGVCRQYIKDLQQAEEVLLNGFLKVFTKINSYSGKGNFEGWIRRIMVNECISFLRVKKNIFLIDDNFNELDIQGTEIEEMNEQNPDYIQQLIDNLKPELRVVFNLFVIEEYKHKEIAELLNISENASKLRYRKAKQELQEQIKSKSLYYGK